MPYGSDEGNEVSWCSFYLLSKIVGLILISTGLTGLVLFAAWTGETETALSISSEETPFKKRVVPRSRKFRYKIK